MVEDNRTIQVTWKSKKYRILKLDPSPGKAHFFAIPVKSNLIELQVSGCILKLEERFWFFGWFWKTVGITNQYSIGKQWVETYFKEKKS